jgi:hypothetical protein
MATKQKMRLSGYAYQRELIELAKTMDLAIIVKNRAQTQDHSRVRQTVRHLDQGRK